MEKNRNHRQAYDARSCIELPSQIITSSFVGYLTKKSTMMIFKQHINLK